MNTVLLAVDESDESVAAVQVARQLFGSDCEYLALNVAERAPSWWRHQPRWGGVYPFPFDAPHPLGAEAPAGDADVAARARATAERVAGEAGVSAKPVTEFGDAAGAILVAAHAHDVDVIVVGAEDKGWWQRLFDSSVSDAVTQDAQRPVLIVRGGQR